MAATRYETAAQIINDAAVECLLSPVVDPFASTDFNFVLMVRLLNSTGNELAGLGGWEQLRKEATLTVQQGDTGFYSLPDDYRLAVDQTTWNRTSLMPMSGPVSSQQAQALKALNVASTLFYPFRQIGGEMEIIGTLPSVGTVLALEYDSDSWVQTALASAPDADKATAATDTIIFDPLMMKRALKYHWKGERGFDVSKAKDDYETAFSSARSSKPAPVLDMAGSGGIPLIGEQNLPWTNWG